MGLQRGSVVFGNLRINRMIGSGSYGRVFSASQVKGRRRKYAIKEARSTQTSLRREYRYMRHLRNTHNTKGIPWVYQLTRYGKRHCMCMEMLSDISLEHRKYRGGGNLGLRTVTEISLQLFTILKTVHAHRIIHRDIKPQNMLTGLNDPQNLYLVDFGIAKRFKSRAGTHIRARRGKECIGTTMFSSARAQQGFEPSRRDDLIAALYTIVYLYRGRLPWNGLVDNDQVVKRKRHTNSAKLMMYFPSPFRKLAEHIFSLRFSEKPDYDLILFYVRRTMQRYGWKKGDRFEWLWKYRVQGNSGRCGSNNESNN